MPEVDDGTWLKMIGAVLGALVVGLLPFVRHFMHKDPVTLVNGNGGTDLGYRLDMLEKDHEHFRIRFNSIESMQRRALREMLEAVRELRSEIEKRMPAVDAEDSDLTT